MSEENAVMESETPEVNDEQLAKMFDNGGEIPEETLENPQEVAEESQDTEPEKEKYVPHGALHEERMRRKELQAEIERIREESKQQSQMMQQVLAQLKQKQEPEPTLDDDPVAYFQHENEKLRQKLESLGQTVEQRQEQDTQAQQINNLVSAYRKSAQSFAETTPDFTDAYTHLVTLRANELKALGHDPSEIEMVLQREEMGLAASALQQGVNPAERIYELAKVRGYKKAEANTEANTEKIKTLEKGVKAAKPTSGAPQGGEITLEYLAEVADTMDAKEFNELWAKFSKNAR